MAETKRASSRASSTEETAAEGSNALTDTAKAATQQAREGVETSIRRIRELNERAIAAARQAGGGALDAYEAALESMVSLEQRLAGASQIDWIKAVVNAQADFTKNIGSAYVQAARNALRQS
jgi:hypothetical protein